MDWSTILSVVAVNLLLSSDNALAIAMATRNLLPNHKKTVLFLGSLGAVIMQILLTYMAAFLLAIPFLKILGGCILTWIAVNLLIADEDSISQPIESLDLLPMILKIMVANTIMSLDNVLAVAVIADCNPVFLGIGLLVSFPVIIAGSSIISGVLAKFPCIMWLGSLFLGWTSGGIIASEPYLAQYLDLYGLNHADVGAMFACIVVVTGFAMSNHKSPTPLGNDNNSDKT